VVAAGGYGRRRSEQREVRRRQEAAGGGGALPGTSRPRSIFFPRRCFALRAREEMKTGQTGD
jgi:hypothetical protein